MKLYYSTHDDGFDQSYFIETHVIEHYDLPYLANECAEDFFDNHDGWECQWPIKFTLYTLTKDNGPQVEGSFEVEMEVVPQFYVSKTL